MLTLLGLCSLLWAPGCGDDQTCVEALGSDCDPLYEPIFEQVFTRTLKQTCALDGNRCHSGANARAGLRMDEIEEAYQLLVPGGRVIPGDPSCSLVANRLAGNGGVMPPGDPLSEAERCAIETWIANGALR
jgi:hypothetical protein